MGNCLRCGVLLASKNPKAKYCGGVCRVMAARERVSDVVVGDGVEWLIGVDGLRRRMSKDLLLELLGRYGVVVSSVVSSKEVEPSVVLPKVVEVSEVVESKSEVVIDKQAKLKELRGVIDDVMGKSDNFVFPDGLDDIKVDYVKLYDGCELDGDYRDLWVRIKDDMNLSSKEKNAWKMKLGAR